LSERRRIGWTAAGTLTVSAIGIVTPVAGLLMVDDAARTVWVLMATVISVGVSVDFGIPDYVATFSQEVDPRARRSLLRRCSVVTGFGSALVAAIGSILWLALPAIREGESFSSASGALLFGTAGAAAAARSVVQVHASALQARRRIAARNLLLVGQAAAQLAFTLVLLGLSGSPFSLPLATAVSSLVAFVVVRPGRTTATDPTTTPPDLHIPDLARYARNRFSVGLLGLTLTQGDRWIAAALTSGTNVVPLLDVAQRFSQPVKMIAIAAATASANQYGALRRRTSELKAFLRKMQMVTVAVCVAMAIAGSLSYLGFLRLTDVDRFAGASWLAILPLLGVVHAATANPVSALVARGRTDIEVRATVLSFGFAVLGVAVVALSKPSLIPWVTPTALVGGSTYLLLVVSRVLESTDPENAQGKARRVGSAALAGGPLGAGGRGVAREVSTSTSAMVSTAASSSTLRREPPQLLPSSVSASTHWDGSRIMCALWLAMCLALPLEAATRTGLVGRGASIVVGAGLVIVLFRRRSATEALATITSFLIVLVPHGVDRDLVFVVVTGFAAYGVGHLLGPARLGRVVVVVAAIDLTISLLEYRRGQEWWVSALGSSLRRAVGEDLRSSGVAGHPLVSSVLLVTGALILWTLAAAPWHRVAAACMLAGGALWHGSRSAIAIPVLVAGVLWVFGSSITRRSMRMAGTVGVAMLILVITGVLTLPGRLSDLSSLGDTDSRTARVEGLSSWSAPLEGTLSDILFGRGMGSSAERVSELGLSSLGLPTVENSFITASYDFGALGILASFGILFVAMRTARQRTESHEVALAVGLLAVSLYGIFFDTIYWALPRVLAAASLGALIATSPRRVRDHAAGLRVTQASAR
jgi:hypothetical protein